MEHNTSDHALQYSPVWRRLAAGSLDGLPLLVLLVLNSQPGHTRFLEAMEGYQDTRLQPLEVLCPSVAIFYSLYFALANSIWGQTLGQHVLHIKVISVVTASIVGPTLSAARWVVSFFLPLLAFFMSASYALYGTSVPLALIAIGFVLTWVHASLSRQKTTVYDLLLQTRVIRS